LEAYDIHRVDEGRSLSSENLNNESPSNGFGISALSIFRDEKRGVHNSLSEEWVHYSHIALFTYSKSEKKRLSSPPTRISPV